METQVPTISSVKELVDTLKSKSPDVGYLDVIKAVSIPDTGFENFYTWNSDHYTRISLAKTDEFELLLTCWEKDQESSIHDFDTDEAWIHTISGKLIEEKFRWSRHRRPEMVSSMTLGTSGFSHMSAPITMHRYRNGYEARTVSLNLYSKPVENWKIYDPLSGNISEKSASYDAVYRFDEDGVLRSY